jgi:hypothetical protein
VAAETRAARRAARAADTARTPSLPLALRNGGANAGRLERKAESRAAIDMQQAPEFRPEAVPMLPLSILSGARQNPSRPSVAAGQPLRKTCPETYAKTALTEPALESRSSQLSGAWGTSDQDGSPVPQR